MFINFVPENVWFVLFIEILSSHHKITLQISIEIYEALNRCFVPVWDYLAVLIRDHPIIRTNDIQATYVDTQHPDYRVNIK